MARLKVFTWADGFHAFSVAATSRAKALEAWGVGRDLFRDGEAREITDGVDYEAAMAEPGEIIRRVLTIDPGAIPRPPARSEARVPKSGAGKRPSAGAVPPRQATRARRPGPTPRERAAADGLEAELRAMDAAHAEALADLADRRAALEREAAELRERQARERRRLVERLKTARRKL